MRTLDLGPLLLFPTPRTLHSLPPPQKKNISCPALPCPALSLANISRPPQSAALLSESTQRLLQAHLLGPSSTLQQLKRHLVDLAAPLAAPLFARLDRLLASSPDVVLLVAVALALVLVVQVLAWVRRAVAWATRLLLRLAFWSGVALGVAFVWQRGPEQTARDVVVVISKIVGFGAAMRDVWVSEYRRYEAQGNQGGGGGIGGEYGYAGTGR